jgi:porphobilinogen synthase
MENFPITRLRRLRQHDKIRDLIRETSLEVNDLVLPLFIRHGENIKIPIASIPGHYQLSIDQLPKEITEITHLKIPAVILFGIPAHKDPLGMDSYSEQGIVQQAIRSIKALAPGLLVISDACFCEYTDHGHCGVINDKTGKLDLDNDASLELLAKQAVSQAQAGADVIAPSGMLDGMVKTIRFALDNAGFTHIPILSYAAKYASGLYAAFRDAAECAPQFGNRKSYQMDPANGQQALREVALDIEEGADMLMVKPALHYLDIIYRVKHTYPGIPLAGYHVSSEYAMIKAASLQGWLNEKTIALETLLSIKRAGADFIISYYAKEVAAWLQE